MRTGGRGSGILDIMFIVDLLDRFFPLVSIAGILIVAAAIIAHYVLFGPRHPEFAKEKRDVRRFSGCEKLIHALTILGFFALGITGFVSVIFFGKALTGWLRYIHIAAAPFFAAALALIALRWAGDCRFQTHDWEWVKKFGGYLGDRGYVPADRYNAGQKVFFWFIAALGILCMLSGLGRMFPLFGPDIQTIIYQIHRYSSLGLFIFVIVHIYLGTVANPGTWHVIVSGYVSFRWAKEHHPLWWKRLDKSGQD